MLPKRNYLGPEVKPAGNYNSSLIVPCLVLYSPSETEGETDVLGFGLRGFVSVLLLKEKEKEKEKL